MKYLKFEFIAAFVLGAIAWSMFGAKARAAWSADKTASSDRFDRSLVDLG